MKIVRRIIAVLLPVILSALEFRAMRNAEGFEILILVPLIAIAMFTVTVIAQLILIFQLKSARSGAFDFFYVLCFVTTITNVLLYTALTMYFLQVQSALNINPLLGLHVLLLIPVLLQVALIILRRAHLTKQD